MVNNRILKKLISLLLATVMLGSSCGEAVADLVQLPDDLNRVEEEVFYHDISLYEVEIPYGVESIDSKAFAYSSVKRIRIPDSVIWIADDAFEGVSDLTICCSEDSCAKELADSRDDYVWEQLGGQYHTESLEELINEILEGVDEAPFISESELDLSHLSEEGITDPETLKAIREYNELQDELGILVAEYREDTDGIISALTESAGIIESVNVEETEQGFVLSTENGSFSVTGDGFDALDEDFEVLSSAATEDGSLFMEIQSGSAVLYLTLNSSGIMLSRSMHVTASSLDYSAASVMDVLGKIDFSWLISTAQYLAETINSAVSDFSKWVNEGIKKLEKEIPLMEAKLKKLQIQGAVDPDGPFHDARVKANSELVFARGSIKTLKGVRAKIARFTIPETCREILDNTAKIRTLRGISGHGHPTETEKTEDAQALVDQLTALLNTSYILVTWDLVDGTASIIMDISAVAGFVAGVCAGGPVGAVTAVAATAAVKKVAVGAIRKLVLAVIGNIVRNVATNVAYDKTVAADDRLHSCMISGTVKDKETGNPLKNVTVSCETGQTVTNAQGQYSLSVPTEIRAYTLTFAARGYVTQKLTANVNGRLSLTLDPVSMEQAVTTVTGTVTDAESGAALQGVLVTIGDESAFTDADGKYTLTVPFGEYTALFSLDGYHTQAEELTLDKPGTVQCNIELQKGADLPEPVVTRDVITFGRYEQDGNLSNGPEAIEWLVLAKQGSRALVVSRYALESKAYNDERVDITWETCTLRSWLNSTFLNTAFTASEQSRIPTVTVVNNDNTKFGTEGGNNTQDKVFLLSISEVEQYFSSESKRVYDSEDPDDYWVYWPDRMCAPTAYVYTQWGCTSWEDWLNSWYEGNTEIWGCWWWLRSPGGDQDSAAGVDGGGYLDDFGDYGDGGGVRPALWINLAS
ncbi:MAG: DUF6273 domain-containing protein [Oscillospiraceae bacterium]|nr:DUF6273 domain-containing protein [Oscillospiraceae bacterium]